MFFEVVPRRLKWCLIASVCLGMSQAEPFSPFPDADLACFRVKCFEQIPFMHESCGPHLLCKARLARLSDGSFCQISIRICHV